MNYWRVAAASPSLKVGDVAYNKEQIVAMAGEAAERKVKIMVFPEMALVGYTAADLFVNPTRQEVFGLVNVEALACGTPVLTYDSGGSPETVDETCGSVVGKDDFEALKAEIVRITDGHPYTSQACMARAAQFTGRKMYEAYSALFEELGDARIL